MDYEQPYHQSMALCRYIDGGDCDPRKVRERWHRTFCCVARLLGFNRATTRILWEDLVHGNWERLHQTDEERLLSPDSWLGKLRDDVFYCSDRWCLDRLTRCHWLYRQYERSLMRGDWMSYRNTDGYGDEIIIQEV